MSFQVADDANTDYKELVRKGYNLCADTYSHDRSIVHERELGLVTERLPAASSVLDVGCGSGSSGDQLSRCQAQGHGGRYLRLHDCPCTGECSGCSLYHSRYHVSRLRKQRLRCHSLLLRGIPRSQAGTPRAFSAFRSLAQAEWTAFGYTRQQYEAMKVGIEWGRPAFKTSQMTGTRIHTAPRLNGS